MNLVCIVNSRYPVLCQVVDFECHIVSFWSYCLSHLVNRLIVGLRFNRLNFT